MSKSNLEQVLQFAPESAHVACEFFDIGLVGCLYLPVLRLWGNHLAMGFSAKTGWLGIAAVRAFTLARLDRPVGGQ